MKKLRLHIIKIGLIGFICAGLLLTAFQPLKASQTSPDFENWLQTVTVKGAAADVDKEWLLLESLNDLGWIALAEAVSVDLYQLLLFEWRQYQAGNKMAAILPAQTLKSPVSSNNQPAFSVDYGVVSKKVKNVSFLSLKIGEYKQTVSYSLITLSIGSIAIGAP